VKDDERRPTDEREYPANGMILKYGPGRKYGATHKLEGMTPADGEENE
jgi:hypothetical protein